MSRAVRILVDVAIVVLALGVIGFVAKGLAPASPVLGGLLRALANPLLLLALAGLFLAFRLRRRPGS
jgi:hypothetical protein